MNRGNRAKLNLVKEMTTEETRQVSNLMFMLDNMKNWKDIHDRDVDTICNGMSESERKAYCMGVENIFNLFSSIVEKNFEDGNYTVLCPTVDIEAQECDIEELNKIISES